MKRLLDIKATSEYVSRGRKPIFRFDVRALDRWIEELPGNDRE